MAFVYWLNAVIGIYSHIGASVLLAPFANSEGRDGFVETILQRFADVIAGRLASGEWRA